MNDRQAMLEASELPQPSVVDIDPEDPSQVLNDNEEDVEEIETPSETTMDAYAEGAEDTGDLYGVHSPKAADRDLDTTQDQEEFVDSEDGENWLETLGKKSAEYGAEAEEELDVVDDSDEHRGHHKSDNRDRPVADKGSGGNAGI
jgi:hypothetical protein